MIPSNDCHPVHTAKMQTPDEFDRKNSITKSKTRCDKGQRLHERNEINFVLYVQIIIGQIIDGEMGHSNVTNTNNSLFGRIFSQTKITRLLYLFSHLQDSPGVHQ